MSEAPVATLLQQFQRRFGAGGPAYLAMAPGRVNLLGDHTDYNDGFVLPMTIDRGAYWAMRRRGDGWVRLYSASFDQALDYALDEPPVIAAGDWGSYVSGVIEELRAAGVVTSGLEGVVAGNMPLGGGLSSSAALEVATAVALHGLFGVPDDPVATAKRCQRVEQTYAGVQCGIMDQFASRLGRRDHALFLDCRSLQHEDIPLSLGEVCVVIVNSNVRRALAGSKYNERRAECQQAVDFFAAQSPGIEAIRDISMSMFERGEASLPVAAARRCRHVIEENQRVLEAAARLRAGEIDAFGALMDASHASLRDLYEVSCPELDALVEIAQGTEGVLGSRMTGAGFGGCTVHLVRNEAAGALEQRLRTLYAQRCRLEPAVFVLSGNLEAGPIACDA